MEFIKLNGKCFECGKEYDLYRECECENRDVTCDLCNGTGKPQINTPCEHNKMEPHDYCIHGKTERHDD